MHSIGFYVFSNAIFDVHDCSKRFHGNQCSAGLPEHGSMHKWTDLVQRHPWFKGKIAPPALFCFSLQKAALVVFFFKKMSKTLQRLFELRSSKNTFRMLWVAR